MKGISRETVIALLLLVFTGGMWVASYQIPDPGYQGMSPAVWPRIVLTAMGILCLVYLIGSVAGRFTEPAVEQGGGGLVGWCRRYRNPLWCFALFLLFLVTMPLLGMLIGGILFVFVILTVLGDNSPRDIAVHAAIAVVMVGAMWAVFTFALGVILPEGEILGPL